MIRKLYSFLFLLFAVGILVSCASTEKYQAKLDTWLGKTERELVMSWGVPDKQYEIDKKTKMISYLSRDTAIYPSPTNTCFGTMAGNAFFTNCADTFPRTVATYYCETIFTIENGRVARWGHTGNNCRS